MSYSEWIKNISGRELNELQAMLEIEGYPEDVIGMIDKWWYNSGYCLDDRDAIEDVKRVVRDWEISVA